MHDLRSVANLGVCLAGIMALTGVEQRPIPIVTREVGQLSTVFTRPELVVLVSIRDKSQSELTGLEGQPWNPPRVRQLAMARVQAVLRVNERSESHPDLSKNHFVVSLLPDLDLAFGRPYILMVNFAPNGPTWPWARPSPPAYALQADNPGFEVDGNDHVHALRQTPELSPYDGKALGDIVKAIDRGR